MSTTKSSVWIFSITWFNSVDSQPIAHKAFERLGKKFVYQWERAPTTGAEHCQGYLNTSKRYFPGAKGECKPLAKQLSALGMKGVTVKVASNSGKEILKLYAMKDDTRIAGPWADRPIYLGKALSCMKMPFLWQTEIIELIKSEPDDRTIHWIDDGEGRVGKSKLCKYLRTKRMCSRIPLGTATQLKTNVIAFGPSRCYVIDLPRTLGSSEKMADLISAIEEVKNGWVVSAMHGKCHELLMEPPHVIVFSNMPPPRAMMSADRWKVAKIDPIFKKLVRVVRIPINGVPGFNNIS